MRSGWIVLIGGLICFSGCAKKPVAKSPFHQDVVEVLNLVNRIRISEKLDSLTMNFQLCKVATKHAESMAKQGKLTTPNMETELRDVQYPFSLWSMSVAKGDDIHRAFESMITKLNTRDAIEDDLFQETGIGFAVGPDQKVYLTQIFANQKGTPARKLRIKK